MPNGLGLLLGSRCADVSGTLRWPFVSLEDMVWEGPVVRLAVIYSLLVGIYRSRCWFPESICGSRCDTA
jgi:hypothetical protein